MSAFEKKEFISLLLNLIMIYRAYSLLTSFIENILE